MNIDLSAIEAAAKEAESVLEQVMRVEPTIAGAVGMFVPEVAVVQPVVLALAPAIEKALTAVAAGNGGDIVSAVAEIFKHLMPGMPNSPTLSSPPPIMPRADTP